MRWRGKEDRSNACKNSGTQSGGAKVSGKEARRYDVRRGDPVGRAWKDSGANSGGTEVSGNEMRRCCKSREIASKMRPDENVKGVVQALAVTRCSGDAERGDSGTSSEEDGGSGMSPDDDEWPARHGLEVGREMSSPSGIASNGGLAQPCRITFDKDNPVRFDLGGQDAAELH
jgi:hypothetical protein